MTDKNIELEQTKRALAELSEALAEVSAAVTAKKNELKAADKQKQSLLKDREEKLNVLKQSSKKVIGDINGIIGKLDKVLENNGTSNDHN